MAYRWLFALTLLCVVGCGYGEVSPTAYEYAQSLYNISNRKLAGHLQVAKTQVSEASDSGDISAKEAKWLQAIIEDAEQERWKQAMKSARRLMEDQIER